MKYIEKEIEMRAVDRKDLINYFIKTGGKETGDGKIAGSGWEAMVGPESFVKLGSFSLSAVKVVLRCKEEIFDRVYSKFCLEFFHAGG